MESRLRVAAVTVVVTLLLSTSVASGQADDGEPKAMDPKAHEALVVGLTHFEAKEYEQAIRQFREGYAIDPRPELMFAIAQAERLSGDCASAIKAYAAFLETNPPERQAAAANAFIDRCRTALGDTGEPEREPEAEAVKPEPEPAPEPVPVTAPTMTPERDGLGTPWYKDKLGATLLASGVVSASVGLGYYVASASDESAAKVAGTYGEYADLMDRAESRRKAAWVGLGVGAGLVTAAVVRYWLRDDEPDRGVGVSVTGEGAAVVYSASF